MHKYQIQGVRFSLSIKFEAFYLFGNHNSDSYYKLARKDHLLHSMSNYEGILL